MKYRYFYKTIILLLTVTIVSGCANLKQVNNYSSNSLGGINEFEYIDYSFTRYCVERCQFDAISKFEIRRQAECNCDIYATADSVTMLIYNAIRGYFEGLKNLSNNELTNYHFDALKGSLEAGSFGDIKIDSDDAEAYSAVGKILLHAFTDLYRKKKIKEYIGQANKPIQLLLQKFQFITRQSLAGELNFKKEKLYDYYREMGLNGNISEYEKGQATIDYYRQLAEINRKQLQLDAFANGLNDIANGHQKLYENRDKLNAKEIKELINQYSSDVQNAVSACNKLKN